MTGMTKMASKVVILVLHAFYMSHAGHAVSGYLAYLQNHVNIGSNVGSVLLTL